MINKTDLRVVKKDTFYYVQIKQRFLFFFTRWVNVTWLEEMTETPIRFKSFIEAVRFINSFAE